MTDLILKLHEIFPNTFQPAPACELADPTAGRFVADLISHRGRVYRLDSAEVAGSLPLEALYPDPDDPKSALISELRKAVDRWDYLSQRRQAGFPSPEEEAAADKVREIRNSLQVSGS